MGHTQAGIYCRRLRGHCSVGWVCEAEPYPSVPQIFFFKKVRDADFLQLAHQSAACSTLCERRCAARFLCRRVGLVGPSLPSFASACLRATDYRGVPRPRGVRAENCRFTLTRCPFRRVSQSLGGGKRKTKTLRIRWKQPALGTWRRALNVFLRCNAMLNQEASRITSWPFACRRGTER